MANTVVRQGGLLKASGVDLVRRRLRLMCDVVSRRRQVWNWEAGRSRERGGRGKREAKLLVNVHTMVSMERPRSLSVG